mmetsp:Transcript_9824/g.37016  ORF Transcript_9824/g.37016 Transcript_9824/m.37016 type:complete len:212 (-) Transcript_9824:66-701(-)
MALTCTVVPRMSSKIASHAKPDRTKLCIAHGCPSSSEVENESANTHRDPHHPEQRGWHAEGNHRRRDYEDPPEDVEHSMLGDGHHVQALEGRQIVHPIRNAVEQEQRENVRLLEPRRALRRCQKLGNPRLGRHDVARKVHADASKAHAEEQRRRRHLFPAQIKHTEPLRKHRPQGEHHVGREGCDEAPSYSVQPKQAKKKRTNKQTNTQVA